MEQFNSYRIIHTNLYTKTAREIIASVRGQWSDGWGENNFRNDRLWRFCEVKQADNGEVIIIVSDDSSIKDYDYCRHMYKWAVNFWYGKSDEEVINKFANDIKKTAVLYYKDDNRTPLWNRCNTEKCSYFHQYNPINEIYFVYDALKNRKLDRYSKELHDKLVGAPLSAEETTTMAVLRKKVREAYSNALSTIKSLDNALDEQIKVLKEKKEKECKAVWENIVNEFGENYSQYL